MNPSSPPRDAASATAAATPAARPTPGLTCAEAAARLQRDGPNALPQRDRRSPWAIVLGVLREPMLLLLLAATAVYVILGDAREAALLAGSVLLVIGLTIYQEQKSERALDALRELGTPNARVIRDGVAHVVAAADLVVGDAIVLSEGDRVPADGRLVEASDLQVDESLLTGESVPLPRHASGDDAGRDGQRDGAGDAGAGGNGLGGNGSGDEAMVHASTLVVRGHGVAEVLATGTATAVGRIGVALQSLHVEATPMQREIRRAIVLFATLAIAVAVLVTVLAGVYRGDWLAAVLAGLTVAIAMIPEEFPVVVTVFLALGAWRMARHQALVRRTPAIEALGAITVLCTDKTGTLTENRMTVAELVAGAERSDARAPLPARLRVLLDTAALASRPDAIDPMDRALIQASAGSTVSQVDALLREYPLSPECPAVAQAWRRPAGDLLMACKGAPETIAGLCRMPAEAHAAMLREVDAMGRRGLRVLAVAAGDWPAGDAASLPPSMLGLRLEWRGLVAFADPLRRGVAEAVAEARAAGVRVVMLTGDHRETARAIATQAGIGAGSDVVEGHRIDAMDDEALARCVASTDVFARVRPEQKLRLVAALKQDGAIAAMTGDGVNDAPALMSAHVGIAMGQRGTDVAREAAAIVLLDDDFVTVVHAIRIGRTIYDNIRRAVYYILAVHVPIAGLAVLPLLGGGPLVLFPLHVVFLQLIIDPACSLVFEREPAAADIMRRPPRPPSARLLDWPDLARNLLRGAAIFAAVVAVYLLARALALPSPQVGALAFTTLVMGNLGLIVVYRSGVSLQAALRTPNAAFAVVATAALAMLVVVTRVDVPAAWFGFTPPPWGLWLLALVLPLVAAALLRAGRHDPSAGAGATGAAHH